MPLNGRWVAISEASCCSFSSLDTEGNMRRLMACSLSRICTTDISKPLLLTDMRCSPNIKQHTLCRVHLLLDVYRRRISVLRTNRGTEASDIFRSLCLTGRRLSEYVVVRTDGQSSKRLEGVMFGGGA